MTVSTVLKNKMLEVSHLHYRLIVEIKDEDGAWRDLSDRDPRLGSIRMSTEKRRNQIVSSVASVSFTNDDQYFDWIDDPSNATTISKFGTFATKFTKGFFGKQVRISDRFQLPDATYEDVRYGTYRVKTCSFEKLSNRVTMHLQQDVDFLKRKGAVTISDGKRHHENKPVSYLVREILKRFYAAGVTSSDFEIPDRIYLTTADGEPAFSYWGKPPEKDSTGRWRNDVMHKPTALMWCSEVSKFYVGIGDEVWSFNPTTEIWTLCGTFADDAFQVRGIYQMATGYLLVVGWKYDHALRYATIKTARILTSSDSMTTNDPGNDTYSFPGEFVIRDTYDSGAYGLAELRVGYSAYSAVPFQPPPPSDNKMSGVNLPVPFPQFVHSACNLSAQCLIGFTTGLRSQVAAGNWELLGFGPQGKMTENPAYAAYAHHGTGTSTHRPAFAVAWGHKPNLAWAADTVIAGPCLFCLETDGNPLGIRCTGVSRIVAYTTYSGTHHVVSHSDQIEAAAQMYDLRFRSTGALDYLYWCDVDWVEEYIDVYGGGNPATCDAPIWHIKKGLLTDDGAGKPEILNANISTLWTAGNDIFAADDSEYAPISVMIFPGTGTIEGRLVQMMNMADMGGTPFKLFVVNGAFSSATLIGSSRYGWGCFSMDDTNEKIYFIDRDTGRVLYVDYSSAPTVFQVLGDGVEPVPQSFFEFPQAEGLVIRTESSKVCLYGINYPYLPGWVNEGLVWSNGKYYLWKWHPEITDRIELFIEDDQNAWDALGLLAQAVDYQIGMDPEGTGFLRRMPTSSDPSEFTIDLDSPIGRYISIEKFDGLDEIVNQSVFIPYEAAPGEPAVTGDLIGYIKEGAQVHFNGSMEVKSEITNEVNVTLHCIKGGPIGTAQFKYILHDFQIQTVTREVVNLSLPRQLRLDNNQDLAVGMFVQVGDWDVGAKIATIEADGDVILDTDMTTAWTVGTAIIARSAEHGKWSTEYGTPNIFTTLITFGEIGGTGLFLKFGPTDEVGEETYNFAVGDRLRVYNPGMTLEKSRTKKYTIEDSDSIAAYGAIEENPDNPYISPTLGKALANRTVSDGKGPHHGWKAVTPLFPQCKPHTIITLKSLKHLPVATANEEKCYIRQVEHDRYQAKSTLILKAIAPYA
jgi:hypothetical protein